jgi:hypothetical protein
MNTIPPQQKTSIWISTWAIFGVAAILVQAIWKLLPLAMEPIENQDLSSIEWVFFVVWLIFMGYTEGYRGFQKAFSPRVVSRAWTLNSSSPKHHIIFAPLYSMGYFYATKKRKIVSWTLTFAIVGIVLFVKLFPYPYRQIVDAGVVLGLSYGLMTLLYFYVRTIMGAKPAADPDLPISGQNEYIQ